MKAELNLQNINKAEELFTSNTNFTYTVLPRLKLLHEIKKELKDYHDLKWSFEFDHVNVNQNRVLISYLPSAYSDLDLFYEIPLVQKFEFRSFLGNSSVHFIDIYNFLLENNYIREDEFVIHAEYRKIPHFILNLEVKRYHQAILNHYSGTNKNLNGQVDTPILEEIKRILELFNPIFKLIVDRFHK